MNDKECQYICLYISTYITMKLSQSLASLGMSTVVYHDALYGGGEHNNNIINHVRVEKKQ